MGSVWTHAQAIVDAKEIRFGVIRIEVQDGRPVRLVEEKSSKPGDDGEVTLRD